MVETPQMGQKLFDDIGPPVRGETRLTDVDQAQYGEGVVIHVMHVIHPDSTNIKSFFPTSTSAPRPYRPYRLRDCPPRTSDC